MWPTNFNSISLKISAIMTNDYLKYLNSDYYLWCCYNKVSAIVPFVRFVSIRISKAVVRTFLLYCRETCTVNARDLQKLEVFDRFCMRLSVPVRWQEFISNTSVRTQCIFDSFLTSIHLFYSKIDIRQKFSFPLPDSNTCFRFLIVSLIIKNHFKWQKNLPICTCIK